MLPGFTAIAAHTPPPPNYSAARHRGVATHNQGVSLAGGRPGGGPCPPLCQLIDKFCLFGTPMCKCMCADGSESGYQDCGRWFPNDCKYLFW